MIDFDKYYDRLKKLMDSGTKLWQITIVATDGSSPAKPGMKMLIPLEGDEYGNLGGGEMEHALIEYVREKQPTMAKMLAFKLNNKGIFCEVDLDVNVDVSTNMICGGSVEAFIEPLFKKDKLYIIGAGHCGKALAHLAKLCGFYVVLIDNRESVLSKDTGLYADRVFHSNYNDFEEIIEFNCFAYIVVMTHGHLHDRHVLERCLGHQYRYLGMIGSKTKVAQTFSDMIQKGYSKEELDQIYAPIGLPIGSQSPYEIAVSICAQLISLKRCEKKDKEEICSIG